MQKLTYKPPLFLKNRHLQTIYPVFFRKFDTSFYERERITTPDDDFLDLDWSCIGSKQLAIISHGLEGNSFRSYVVGMVRAFNKHGWDALAWNYRSCSQETNRKLRFYHNGTTDDLECVINHAMNTERYESLVLIGLSMGGNLSLVYLGQKGANINPIVKKAVVFSVPCDLKGSSIKLAKPINKILYMKRFLNMLHEKIKAKMEIFPHKINDLDYNKVQNFKDFDDRYTAPIHGFKNAEDYWHKCSSKQFIPQIKIPTLIVNAANDPFLSESCYPIEEAAANPKIFLEIPQSGGHVGFVEFNKEKMYWSERRAIQFVNKAC